MPDLAFIYDSFYSSNNYFLDKEANSDPPNTDHWIEMKETNAYAYYILLFAAFEYCVNNYTKTLIESKNTLEIPWEERRAWDHFDINNMKFMKKVALLTEKGEARYNKILDYYRTRCMIAHTTAPGKPVHVPKLFEDLVRWIKELDPFPSTPV